MRSAHDEQRAAEIRAVHCRTRQGRRRVCAACGQTWPCTDYAWATYQPPRPWTWRDATRVATAVVVAVVGPALTYRLLPTWAWLVLLAVVPVLSVAVLAAASRRRP